MGQPGSRGRRLRWALVVAWSLAALTVAVPAAAVIQEEPADYWYTDGVVYDLLRVGDAIYLGGNFDNLVSPDGQQTSARSNFAAIDATSGVPLPFVADTDDTVHALAASTDGTRVFVGGNFKFVNGLSRNRVAAVDAVTGTVDSGFLAGTGGWVRSMLVDGNDLFLAGEITAVKGIPRNRIAKISAVDGALDTSFAPDLSSGSVWTMALAPNGNRLYVGGTFGDVDGVAGTAHAVGLSPTDGAVDTSWTPDVDQPLFDIAPYGADAIFFAIGGFGIPNNRLQKHDTATGAELFRYIGDGDFQALDLDGDTLYIGGHFEKDMGGLPRTQLAAIDADDGRITDLSPAIQTLFGVWDVLAEPEGVFIGGEFTLVELQPRDGFALLPDDGEPPVGTQELLFDRWSSWRFDASGDSPTPGTNAWAFPGYDDSAWPVGGAEIGFGDNDEVTVIGQTDTLYARRIIDIPDADTYTSYAVRHLADAGAAVYVNGVEVVRDNLPDGPLSASTLALNGRWTSAERTLIESVVSPVVFTDGPNVIAVEVHSAYPFPGDMSFALELIGQTGGAPPPPPGPVTLVGPGSNWTYLDDGTDPGGSWADPAFDDGGWTTSVAEFGFGDGDEATVVESGHVGYFFRNRFTHQGSADSLTLDLLVDDGAVVYLNGTELLRVRMPLGPITASSQATEPVWGAEERTFVTYALDPGLLVQGQNVLAVSAHNVWAGNGDLSFNAELEANISGDPPAVPTVLVSDSSAWKYDDTRVEPAVGWTAVGYDDSAWSSGDAQLGWGDGDEATVVSAGNGFPTTYFRRSLNVGDPSQFDYVEIGLLRDDGAVVHINGVEAGRSNMPAGPIGGQTLAAGYTYGGAESTYMFLRAPAELLVPGANVVAVELHQADPSNADASFDLTLVGHPTPVDVDAPTTATGLAVTATTHESVSLSWAPATDDTEVFDYIVRRNGSPVGRTSQTGYVDGGLALDTSYSYDVVTVDTSGNRSAPSAGVVGTTAANPPADPALIALGATWTWSQAQEPAGWMAPAFDDSGWGSGPAQLGWGDGDEATPLTPPGGSRTAYFRHELTVDDPAAFSALEVGLVRDDGAVVYVNGVEVGRDLMPIGPIDHATLATDFTWGSNESQVFTSVVPASLLVAGTNVVAVELHQGSNNNGDGSFDLRLTGLTTPGESTPPTPPGAPAAFPLGPTEVELSWVPSTDDSQVVTYRIERDGTPIGHTVSPLYVDATADPATSYTYGIVAIDTYGNESAAATVGVTTPSTAQPLVPLGSTWAYSFAVEPGGWAGVGFDDSGWATGPAELGWGDGGEATVLDPPGGSRTSYYRFAFDVADPDAFSSVEIGLRRDDGAVVYVNGVEAVRDLMPAGPIDHDTLASDYTWGTNETRVFTYTVPASMLATGPNVVAVELHQGSNNNADGSFDLSLTGIP